MGDPAAGAGGSCGSDHPAFVKVQWWERRGAKNGYGGTTQFNLRRVWKKLLYLPYIVRARHFASLRAEL